MNDRLRNDRNVTQSAINQLKKFKIFMIENLNVSSNYKDFFKDSIIEIQNIHEKLN
jgi:hypothetical protein